MERGDRPTERAVLDAMKTLGVDATMSWDQTRDRYRAHVRKAHPDVTGRSADSDQAAALNVAYDTLCQFTSDGRLPLPVPLVPPPTPTRHQAASEHSPVVLHAELGDVFVQLLEGAHGLGEVSYMDPEAGLIQVLLDQGGPGASQLLIAVDLETDPPLASFTLDTPDGGHAPQLREVVDRLGELLSTT